MPKTYDIEFAKLMFKKNNLTLEDNEENKIYQGIYKHMTAYTEEGYKVSTNICNLKKGQRPAPFSKFNPYTIWNIKNIWIPNNAPNLKLLSKEWIRNNKPLLFEDDNKYLYQFTIDNFYKNKDNLRLFYITRPEVSLYNMINWLKINKNNKIKLKENQKYMGTNYEYIFICYKHGDFKALWDNIYLRNHGCPYCSNHRPSKDNNLLIINPELCEEWDFNKNKKQPEEYLPNSNKKVWWKCKKCEHEWKAIISNRNLGRMCPKCNASSGQKRVTKWLDYNKYNYETEYTKLRIRGYNNGVLRFDFVIFEKENNNNIICIIEYDGEQHFKPGRWSKDKNKMLIKFKHIQYNDKIKDTYCKTNNIPLLRIPYWEYENTEIILEKWFKKFIK